MKEGIRKGGTWEWDLRRKRLAPNATANWLFWIVYVSVSSNVSRMSVSASFTRGSVSRGVEPGFQEGGGEVEVVSWASLTCGQR
jgi:hypothetical protein